MTARGGATRRALISRAALLAAGGAGLFLMRDRLPWPPLRPSFADGRATPWLPLPPNARLIEIEATVNGRAVGAVVDSGAQLSAVDAALAERLDLPATVAAPILAYGVGGQPRLSHTVHLDLGLPGLAVAGVRAAALDLAAVSSATGRDFQLLIGRDVLRQVIVEADFAGGRARLLDRQAYSPPRDAMVIPLGGGGGAPTAPVRIDGAPPLDLLVDTGASGAVALSEPAARTAGLLAPGRAVSRAHSVSLGGLSLDRVVRARSVSVGPLHATGIDVQIYARNAHAPAPSGLLGAGLLSQFRIALDLSGQRLYLVPPPLRILRPGLEQRS